MWLLIEEWAGVRETDCVVYTCLQAEMGIDKKIVLTNRNINLLQVNLKTVMLSSPYCHGGSIYPVRERRKGIYVEARCL
jgi:hypothetical protein